MKASQVISKVKRIIAEANSILEVRQCEETDDNPLSAPVASLKKNSNSRANKDHSMAPKNKLAAPYGAYNIVRAGIATGSPTITDRE